jgi:hypothetical protein
MPSCRHADMQTCRQTRSQCNVLVLGTHEHEHEPGKRVWSGVWWATCRLFVLIFVLDGGMQCHGGYRWIYSCIRWVIARASWSSQSVSGPCHEGWMNLNLYELSTSTSTSTCTSTCSLTGAFTLPNTRRLIQYWY